MRLTYDSLLTPHIPSLATVQCSELYNDVIVTVNERVVEEYNKLSQSNERNILYISTEAKHLTLVHLFDKILAWFKRYGKS